MMWRRHDTRCRHLEKGNNLLSFENHYRCKDGTYRCLLWAAAADVNHQLIYASAIDITERKKQEQELLRSKQNIEAIALKLQEQNRQLDEFAHIISHNLRSPIGNIKALIGLLHTQSSIQNTIKFSRSSRTSPIILERP